jgi:hypothetical protein
MTKIILDQLQERRRASRRRFLAMAGLAGASAAAAGGLGALEPRRARAAAAAYTDPKKHVASTNDILNFALNLEYLEAEYYLRASTGAGLAADEITGTDSTAPGKEPNNKASTPGDVTGGAQVPFASPLVAQVAAEIAADEHSHVLLLREALGKHAVARPTIDLTNSFTAAATAAGIITSGQTFNPFASDDAFLLGAFLFEDVGVTAYNGAVTHIGDGDTLQDAAGILAVEAYHAGAIRALLLSRGQTIPSDITAANDISALRDAAGGDDVPLTNSNNDAMIAATDSNGLAFARTFNQVLAIVYLGGAAGTGGGFFPQAMNGAIA